MTSTILIVTCAVVSAVISFIVNVITSPDYERINDRFSKMWSRLQKLESKIDKVNRHLHEIFHDENKQVHKEFLSIAKGITETRSMLTTLTGYTAMDKLPDQNKIVATNKKGKHFLIDLDFLPAKISAMELKKDGHTTDTVEYKGGVFEYTKPVDIDF